MAPDEQQYEPTKRLATNASFLVCCPTYISAQELNMIQLLEKTRMIIINQEVEWKEQLKAECERQGYKISIEELSSAIKALKEIRNAAQSSAITAEELPMLKERFNVNKSNPPVNKGIPWNPRKSKRPC
jgi:hypothetical protein